MSTLGLPVVRAQSAAEPGSGPPPDNSVKLEKFIVTGSNIPTTEIAEEASTFPVLSLDRQAIDLTGMQSTAELLQSLSVSNGGAVPISNNGTGPTPSASSASIHGFGPDATLILINGHRVANYPVGEGTVAFVDLNTIPLAAVERIEVLKDGASAIYGADAVAGVINIILRKDYNGTLVTLRYGNTTNRDSSEYNASILSGASSRSDSISVSFSYEHRAAILNLDRAYSAQAVILSRNSSPINAQITTAAYDAALGLPPGTSPPGVTRPVFFATPGVYPGSPGGNFVPTNGDAVQDSTNFGLTPASEYIYSNGKPSVYNYNQVASSFPDLTRYGAVASGEHRLSSSTGLTAYYDLSVQRNQELNVLAPFPSGPFSSPGSTELVIPANTPNPLPLPDGRARAAPPGADNPFNPFNLDIVGNSAFRFADFGNRIDRDTNDAAMVTVGMRADNFAGGWNGDAGVRYSQIVDRLSYTNISVSRLDRVLNQADPIFDPSSPDYIGTTIAYNPFGYYVNPIAANQKVIAYALHDSKSHYLSWLGNGFLTVNNPSWWRVPAGDIGVAGGLDYRRETLSQDPDPLNASGDALGLPAETTTNSSRDVLAVYAEIKVPVVGPAQAVPGVFELTLDAAVRNEDFLTSRHDKTLPKVGLHWSPWGDTFGFRASYGTGIRQPSLYELFVSEGQGIDDLTDPRDGSDIEVNSIVRHNSALRLEETNSTSVGAVWSPHGALQNFTIAVDCWRVERNGTVDVDPQNTLDRYFGTAPGGPQPGEQVTFDGAGNILSVTSLYLNMGETVGKGVDLSSSYLLKTKSLGRFDFSLNASYLHSLKIALLPGEPSYELVGKATDFDPVDMSSSASDGYLRWKGSLTAGWTIGPFNTSVTARYTDGFQYFDSFGDPATVGSTVMYDVHVVYDLGHGKWSYLRGVKFSCGARNVTDKDPPAVNTGTVGYPGSLYDAEGRFWYASLEKKF